MSLILLHRLEFPIKVDVLLLITVTTLLLLNLPSATLSAVPESSRDFPIYSDLSDSNGYDNVHRVYHSADTLYRNENVRWRKMAPREMERRVKRNANVESSSLLPIVAVNSTNKPKFDFSHRGIEKINFSELGVADETILSDIVIGNFSNNKLNEISHSVERVLINVERLDVSYNDILTFDSAFGKLNWLNLSNNRLEQFTSEHVPNLRTLDLSSNSIDNTESINFRYFRDLEVADLSCNNLKELHRTLFQNTTNLKVVNLSGNHLKRILKNYFFTLVNIETLVLASNDISDIENDTFAYLPNLQYLDLSHNDIDAGSIRTLQGIDLVGLSVAYNAQLGNALQGFVASWSLKELDASGTGLCQIPAALAQSVHTLSIADNHFQIIRCGDLDSYPLLQNLDLSFNKINDIEDDAMGRLEILVTLNLSNNNITYIPSSLPSSLINLYLHNNGITDVQPTTIAQLINLEILNLSGNKLTYLPGLPLPRLLTLNLRSSGLRGLSQTVVKTSPNLKDLFLENNPIKCTELLGIAEWASPCRNEKLFETFDGRTNEDETTVLSILSTLNKSQGCRKSVRKTISASEKPVCPTEKLIISSRLTNELKTNESKQQNNVTTTIPAKTTTTTRTTTTTTNRQDLWNVKDGSGDGGKFLQFNQFDYNKTTQSTSKDENLNRKLDDNGNGKMVNKSMFAVDVNDVSLNERVAIKSGGNIVNSPGKLRMGESGIDVDVVPNGKTMNSVDMVETTTTYDANYLIATTGFGYTRDAKKSRSNEKLAKRKKNMEKVPHKNGDIVPMLQKYFLNNETKTVEIQPLLPPPPPSSSSSSPPPAVLHDLHNFVNQTKIDNKNSLKDETTLFETFNGNRKVEQLQTENNHQRIMNGGGGVTVTAAVSADDVVSLNDNFVTTATTKTIFVGQDDNGNRHVDDSAATTRRMNKGPKKKLKQLRFSETRITSHQNDKLNPEMDVYLNDEEAKPQKVKEMNGKVDDKDEKLSASYGNDKLDNLPDSLAQMMTGQKDNNILTQTGFVKQSVVVALTPQNKQHADNEGNDDNDANDKQQLQKMLPHHNQQQHQQQQQNQYGNNKKEKINWNTSNPISYKNNENTNNSQRMEAAMNVEHGNVVKQREYSVDQTNKYKTTATELTQDGPIKANQSVRNRMENTVQQHHQHYINVPKQSSRVGAVGMEEKTTNPNPINIMPYKQLNDHYDGNINFPSKGPTTPNTNNNGKIKGIADVPITVLKNREHFNKTINNAENLNNQKTKQTVAEAGGGGGVGAAGASTHTDIVNASVREQIGGENVEKHQQNMKIKINSHNVGRADNNKENEKMESNKMDVVQQCTDNAGNGKCENDIYGAENALDDAVTELKNKVLTLRTEAMERQEVTASDSKKSDAQLNMKRKSTKDSTIEPSHLTMPSITTRMGDEYTISNTSTSSGLPEQWNDVRNSVGHPGLFIVIGVTIGMILSLALIHIYRCRKPWHRQNLHDDDQEQYTPTHHDLLPMEILNSSHLHYSDSPIGLW